MSPKDLSEEAKKEFQLPWVEKGVITVQHCLRICYKPTNSPFWKDVDGIWSKDPNTFEDAVQLPEVSFREAVEFTYYGAKVLHSKTIQPLANLNIELHVRSFLSPEKEEVKLSIRKKTSANAGIDDGSRTENIVVTQLETKDYSYISLGSLKEILEQF